VLVTGPEVEAHAAAAEVEVARITLELDGGEPVVLQAAGDDLFTVVSGPAQVEGHPLRYRVLVPGAEVEAHAAQVILEPAEVEGHGFRKMRASTPEPGLEAHALTVRRLTLHPTNGEALVLDPAGADGAGNARFSKVSGPAEVEGHMPRRSPTDAGPEGYRR